MHLCMGPTLEKSYQPQIGLGPSQQAQTRPGLGWRPLVASGHYSQAFDHSLPHCWLILEIVMMVVVLVNYDENGDDDDE